MALNRLKKNCPNEFIQNRSARYLRSAYIRCTGVILRNSAFYIFFPGWANIWPNALGLSVNDLTINLVLVSLFGYE